MECHGQLNQKIFLPNILSFQIEFSTVLLSGQDDEGKMSSRIERLRFSLAQDIVYIVTDSRVKTPQSVLLKSLSNIFLTTLN